uniref:PX domain-containing protein n=1 Tax=Eutreptiella gymnastica TaxID=73025 RepID=A0A7S1HU62_9EUGL
MVDQDMEQVVDDTDPIPCDTPTRRENPTPGSSQVTDKSEPKDEVIFEFRDVKNVHKVHSKEGMLMKLDYWSYDVTLETDAPAYSNPKGTNDLVTIQVGRRYKEFEWLRETLVSEHPYSVVPPLPGFALEGMLEKVDNILGSPDTSQEIPALVTYRMRGITLFLKWLARCPTFRDSPSVKTFMEATSEEISALQAAAKAEAKTKGSKRAPETTLGSIWGSLKSRIQGPPKQVPDEVLHAKQMMTALETCLSQLKDNVEKLWDQIVNLCEGYIVERFDPALQKSDEVMQALVKTAVVVKRAVHSFSVENEELFLGLVVDLSFYNGLCSAAKSVISSLERMAADVQQLQQAGRTADAQALEAEFQDACRTFMVEYQHFHWIKKPSLKKMVHHFALLATNMDPKKFQWEKYCAPLLQMIPDPEW